MLAHVLLVLLCGITPLVHEEERPYVQTLEDIERLSFLEKHSIVEDSFPNGLYRNNLKNGLRPASKPQGSIDRKRFNINNMDPFAIVEPRELSHRSETDSSSCFGIIPKIFHFIWLGPKPFPKESIPRIRSWLDKHPTWKAKFWTDHEGPLPDDRLEKIGFAAFPLHDLLENYFDSDQEEERSELLRYAILSDQGGVYIDPGIVCLNNIDLLTDNLDFFCGLEPLGPSILSSSVNLSPYLIGSSPAHPIFLKTNAWLKQEWNRVGSQFPGKDPSSVFNRVKHRTFQAFNEGVFQGIDIGAYRNCIFSAHAFNALDKKNGEYAFYEGDLPGAPRKDECRKQFQGIEKKISSTFFWLFVLGGSNLILGGGLFFGYKKMRGFLFFMCFTSVCFSGAPSDFEELMGRNTPHWNHLHQEEDFRFLKAANDLYQKNKDFQFERTGIFRIPQVIHFIWLGPKPFPPESVENIRTWIARNPDWKVKFWTDRDRQPPCRGIELVSVKDFRFTRLGACYEESDNWGEKSDLLRYEILFQEGGVYADHDANCLKTFEGLHQAYDFYCCLETPHEPFVGLNITCGNGVIGSCKEHPTLKGVIELIADRWDSLGNKYRGKDQYSRIEIVMQRTYIALTEVLKMQTGHFGNRDIIFPASYFFSKSHMEPLYSKHFYATAWDDLRVRPSESEKGIEKFLKKMEKKSNSLFNAMTLILGLNCCLLLGSIFKKGK